MKASPRLCLTSLIAGKSVLYDIAVHLFICTAVFSGASFESKLVEKLSTMLQIMAFITTLDGLFTPLSHLTHSRKEHTLQHSCTPVYL